MQKNMKMLCELFSKNRRMTEYSRSVIWDGMRLILALILILPVLFALSGCNSDESHHVQLANSLMSKYAKKMRKEKGLQLHTVGGSMMNQIEVLTLRFLSHEKMEIPEARKFYLEVVEGALPIVNADEKIRSYLKNYPFTHENIDFSIVFYDKSSNKRVDPPYVAHVFYSRGRVVYSFYDREKDRFDLDLKYAEKYEDALRIVQQESKNG